MNRYHESDNEINIFVSKPAIAIYALIVLLLATWIFGPFKRVKTEVGNQTVVVDTPLIFGAGGVRDKALEPGAEWIWSTTKLYSVNPKPFIISRAIDDFVSVDNILLDFESTVTVQVTDWPRMMKEFGPEWWKNNLERPYFSFVREEIKVRSMKEMMSSTTVSKEVDDSLTTALTNKVKELNLPVRIVEINLGRAKPNAKILEQMNDTAAEQQRLLTLEQSRLAEIKRAQQQEAKAIADNAYRNKIGLNVSEFVQLQLADKQIEACKGAKECVFLPVGTPAVVGR
ncbi:hypothetical protein LUCX_232 [Xanthomonas phage vB_XciM_LucasX]|nr:hypothetical protein LUCX_232 [Xanthomonas phage vB_XciM_LucasX]